MKYGAIPRIPMKRVQHGLSRHQRVALPCFSGIVYEAEREKAMGDRLGELRQLRQQCAVREAVEMGSEEQGNTHSPAAMSALQDRLSA